MKHHYAITGVGVLSPIGEGKDAFWKALRAGECGVRPLSQDDPEKYGEAGKACELIGFDPKVYLGPKGHRTLDRASKICACTGKLAMEDAGVTTAKESWQTQAGAAVGTNLASVRSVMDFDLVTLNEGPRGPNPALFPNTVMNTPASQMTLLFGVKGFNSTVSSGFGSSMDALQYACDLLDDGEWEYVVAGGLEEICPVIFEGFAALQYLSGSRPGQTFFNGPFDRRRNGAVLAEGCALFVLESIPQARDRGARIYAELLSTSHCTESYRIHKLDPRGRSMITAMTEALDDAGVGIADIDWIAASANSTPDADRIEARAIREVFGRRAQTIPVSAIKSMVGESYGASGALNVCAAIGSIVNNFIPPTIHYEEPDPDVGLDGISSETREAHVKTVLVNAFGPGGASTSAVVRCHEG